MTKELSDRNAIIWRLVIDDGISQSEAARTMGISINRVHQILFNTARRKGLYRSSYDGRLLVEKIRTAIREQSSRVSPACPPDPEGHRK